MPPSRWKPPPGAYHIGLLCRDWGLEAVGEVIGLSGEAMRKKLMGLRKLSAYDLFRLVLRWPDLDIVASVMVVGDRVYRRKIKRGELLGLRRKAAVPDVPDWEPPEDSEDDWYGW